MACWRDLLGPHCWVLMLSNPFCVCLFVIVVVVVVVVADIMLEQAVEITRVYII